MEKLNIVYIKEYTDENYNEKVTYFHEGEYDTLEELYEAYPSIAESYEPSEQGNLRIMDDTELNRYYNIYKDIMD